MHRPYHRKLIGSLLFASIASGCAGTNQSIVRREPSVAVEPTLASDLPDISGRASISSDDQTRTHAEADGAIRPVAFSRDDQVAASSGSPQQDSKAEAAPVAPPVPPSASGPVQSVDSTPDIVIETAEDSVTLEELEQIALANNPTIQQLAASASKAAGVRDQIDVSPNPTFGYFGSQLADRGTDQHGLYVEQEFVRGDKLQLNRAVLNQSVQARMWDVEAQRYRVLTDVRMRFFEALAAQQQLEATNAFQKVAERGLKAATERREAGEASQIEVLQARIQLNEVRLASRQAYATFQGAWKDLVSVSGVPTMEPRVLVADPDVVESDRNWDSLAMQIMAESPELAAARARVCEASAMVRRQEAQPIPNLTVQLGAGMDNGTDNGLINLQIGAPIPVFNDNSGNISAAYADYCRATHEVRRIEMAIKARLARASQDFESAKAAVNQYQQQILPDADETLKLSEQAYGAGEIDFLQVLIVRRTYFDANIRYIQARGNLAMADARVQGLLLTGGLDAPGDFSGDDGLRGQSFGGM